MLLTADQVLQLVVHSQPIVRQQAADYFAFSATERLDVADQAIRAIQQFGWGNAFRSYRFLAFLPLRLEALDWLLDEMTSGQVGEDDQLGGQLAMSVAAADVNLLAARHERLLSMSVFSEKDREEIEQRLLLRKLPPEQLWDNLIAWCTKHDEEHDFPTDYSALPNLCEALGRFPEFSAPRALQRLARPPGDPEDWLGIAAVHLAGELRLTDAIQPIVDRIANSDDLLFEATEDALRRIGGDGVVAAMAAAFPQGDYGLELLTASVLATIHSETSVRTCLDLSIPRGKVGAFIALQLCIAALSSFASEAIEPGRQLVLAAPHDPEVTEVRRPVVAVCLAHGVSIPELDAWAADVENDDREFRQRLTAFLAESLRDDEDADDEAWDDGAAKPSAPAETIIRDHQRIGRNAPCPCGSGKKYKKCCLGKEKAIG